MGPPRPLLAALATLAVALAAAQERDCDDERQRALQIDYRDCLNKHSRSHHEDQARAADLAERQVRDSRDEMRDEKPDFKRPPREDETTTVFFRPELSSQSQFAHVCNAFFPSSKEQRATLLPACKAKDRRTAQELLHTSSAHREFIWPSGLDCSGWWA